MKRRVKRYWTKDFLRLLVRDRKLTPIERISSRVGYMGAGFLMAGQWTVEPILFIIGFISSNSQKTMELSSSPAQWFSSLDSSFF